MRPKYISIFCIILFILQGLALVGSTQGLMIALGISEFNAIEGQDSISNAVTALTVPAAIYGVLANILSLVSVYGLWKMKRWGVYLFTAIIAVGMFITFVVIPPWAVKNEGHWWIPLILPIIYMCVVLPSWKQLSVVKNT